MPCGISLKNLRFKYDGNEIETIKGIDLEIASGEKISIVGLNGAGKTTLAKIICGLLNPTEGKVLVSGKNMNDFNRDDYYKLFSVVFQDSTVLPTSIAKAVAQRKDCEIDRDKVIDCLKKADIIEKIKSLPDGIDSKLRKEVYNQAVTLSGGETQRLMIARAIYKDAPIIILDEPTAALDPIAESNIYMHYHKLTEKKTSLFISHRLASTQFCDRIIMLEDGQIIEEGSHSDLMALKGKYFDLFEIQSAYYKESYSEMV